MGHQQARHKAKDTVVSQPVTPFNPQRGQPGCYGLSLTNQPERAHHSVLLCCACYQQQEVAKLTW